MLDSLPEPWRTRSRREVYDASPWLRLYADEVELPDGRVVAEYFSLDMPDHAIIVAVTPDGQVVVERNYKHGPRQVCLNLPAGYLEPGEDPLNAAKRELLEETGYVADVWTFLGAFAEDGNRGCGRAFIYLAQGAREVSEPASGDLEEMVIGLLSMAELFTAARNGETPVLGVVAALGLAAAELAQPR
ncbi:MAG: NUDIX hydrolase [Chloroflexota bacterium]